MIDGLVADDIDDAAARPSRIVQTSKTVGEAGAAMQQGASGLFGHPPISVGGTGDDVFLQAEDAFHAGNAIQRGDEMHLAGPRVGETDLDPAAEQRVHQAFGSVHRDLPPVSAGSLRGAAPGCKSAGRRGPGVVQ